MAGRKTFVVIGGGAAGFFCAVNAARLNPSLQVIIVEKSDKLLSKVKISGGGRCNVTHGLYKVSELVKRYPRGTDLLQKSLKTFGPAQTVAWFDERGVTLKTEEDGRMFPVTDRSQTIIDCLLTECEKYEVDVRVQMPVISLARQGKCWMVGFRNGETLMADYVCVACGGYPTFAQFAWLQDLNHAVVTPVPSLFTFNIPHSPLKELMGVSVPDVTISIEGTGWKQRGPMLITHWGLSGPAILKLSAYAARELHERNYSFTIRVHWVPEYHETALYHQLTQWRTEKSTQKIINRNPVLLPSRLWEWLLTLAGITENDRWADLRSNAQHTLCRLLTGHSFKVHGKTTFKEEFVTAGGIATSHINPLTMESRLHPGLYFAGEILNVDGITGGFNFQHAWSSGFAVAQALASLNNELD
ncbi:MAG: NAD(P)/FAD-dependent oxidoreductase [Ferruginibacter sp.]